MAPTRKAVPGYELRVVGEHGEPVSPGEMGELQIADPPARPTTGTTATKSRSTFHGGWTKKRDKYIRDKDGYYVYGGRSDDMLKVSGIYVSPAEVEAALIGHEAVLEAAVVGAEDENKLIKPKAFVVLKPGNSGNDALKARCSST